MLMETIIDNFGRHWRIGSFLDRGSFGKVSRCFQIKFANDETMIKRYVVKIEKLNSKSAFTEWKIYQKINTVNREDFIKLRKIHYVPLPHLIGHSISSINQFLILHHYRYNLSSYMKTHKMTNLSMNRCFKIAYQSINAIEYLQNLKIVHRDIKSSNIVFDNIDYPHLIDFGLCDTIGEKRSGHVVGTLKYCSIDAHKGLVTARSDLENLLYCIFTWLNATSLPWCKTRNKHMILMRKQRSKSDDYHEILSEISTIPFERLKYFEEVVYYILSLKPTDVPNFKMLRDLFLKLAISDEAHSELQYM